MKHVIVDVGTVTGKLYWNGKFFDTHEDCLQHRLKRLGIKELYPGEKRVESGELLFEKEEEWISILENRPEVVEPAYLAAKHAAEGRCSVCGDAFKFVGEQIAYECGRCGWVNVTKSELYEEKGED